MAIAAFPLAKLGALALRQIAKPMANHLKVRAKDSNFFRNGVCIPVGQMYHTIEVKVKAKMLNLKNPAEVVRLNEQAAIDLGAELIGEVVIFIVAAATIVAEYARQSRKLAIEKAASEDRLLQIEATQSDLVNRSALLEQKFGEVQAKLDNLQDTIDKVLTKLPKK